MGIMARGTGSSQSVQFSRYAYVFGGPVAFRGVAGYPATFILSGVSLQPRFAIDRRVTVSLAVVSGIDVAFTAYLSYLEAFVIDAWCRWCLLSVAIITGISVYSLFAPRQHPAGVRMESPA